MKALNLYAGIGGNRKLWDDVEVTAIELDPVIAALYQEFFPDDTVIVADAHQYLLDHYTEYDFIWSSPPCQTHSKTNVFLNAQGCIRYPDMKLWQEIIFLKQWHEGKWVVENVKPYYELFLPATVLDRHCFWSNFLLAQFKSKRDFNITQSRVETRIDPDLYVKKLEEYHGFVFSSDIGNTMKRLLLRNCVYPPLGRHILDCARGNTQLAITSFTE